MNPFKHSNLTSSFLCAILLAITPACLAGNRAQPTVLVASSYLDPATHMYVYSYTITNPVTNTAPVDTLVLKLQPGVSVMTGFQAPPGWRAFYSNDKLMWAAIGFFDPNAQDTYGDTPPSDYALAPGRSLGGFVVRSFGAPGTGTAITQTYAPLPHPANEDEMEAMTADQSISDLPEENGFNLTTTLPYPDVDWTGNRRPSVDGFLVFGNLTDKSSFKGSALIVLRLGSAGEVVYKNTLHVLLNGFDVTTSFIWSDQYKGYAATFGIGSPIVSGTNVLHTSVDGIVPGTTNRVATDTDRVTFTFTP